MSTELEEIEFSIEDKKINQNNYPQLNKTIIKFVIQTLRIPEDYKNEEEEIELLYFNAFKANGQLTYFRVKSLIEVLGKNEGESIYKKIVPELIKDMNKGSSIDKDKNPREITLTKQNDDAIKHWCKIGLVNFTEARFDEYKTLYRFDKCVVPEILHEFNDPDIAYLSSCYIGDAESFNEGKIIHMRRSQTLHHGTFCDEFYWNNIVYKDEKQPSLEITRNLGRK